LLLYEVTFVFRREFERSRASCEGLLQRSRLEPHLVQRRRPHHGTTRCSVIMMFVLYLFIVDAVKVQLMCLVAQLYNAFTITLIINAYHIYNRRLKMEDQKCRGGKCSTGECGTNFTSFNRIIVCQKCQVFSFLSR